MKKVLMVASVPSMIGQFNMNNIKILQELGCEVHVACNFSDRSAWTKERIQRFVEELEECKVKKFTIDFARDIRDICKHLRSYKQIQKLVDEQHYTCIHCHTPVASAITRWAAHKKNVKIIYTAHGFHFYKGAPFINNLIYKGVEMILAHHTDVLITINREDYRSAKMFRLRDSGNVYYVPGIGVDTERYRNIQVDKKRKRQELGVPEDAIVLLSVGELTKGKNHGVILQAMSRLNNPKVVCLICGQGKYGQHLRQMSRELQIEDNVRLLGFRNDIGEICKASDIFIFPSLREGLSVALMEAMASGLPIVCSKIRGNVDLVNHGVNGFLCETKGTKDYAKAIEFLLNNQEHFKKFAENNLKDIKKMDKNYINRKMKYIYQNIEGLGE